MDENEDELVNMLPLKLRISGIVVRDDKVVDSKQSYGDASFSICVLDSYELFVLSSEFAVARALAADLVLGQNGTINRTWVIERGDLLYFEVSDGTTRIHLNGAVLKEIPACQFAVLGYSVLLEGNCPSYAPLVSLLCHRTYDEGTLETWRTFDSGRLLPLSQASCQFSYQFALLQTLSMSPMPTTLSDMAKAFVRTPKHEMIQYHRIQIEHGAKLIEILASTQSLLVFFQKLQMTEKRSKIVQSGVMQQVWRAWLRYCRLVAHDDKDDYRIFGILIEYAISEAFGRCSLYQRSPRKLQHLFLQYLNQYMLAYDSEEFALDAEAFLARYPQAACHIFVLGVLTFSNSRVLKGLAGRTLPIINESLLNASQEVQRAFQSTFADAGLLFSETITAKEMTLDFRFEMIYNFLRTPQDDMLQDVFRCSQHSELAALFCARHFARLPLKHQMRLIMTLRRCQLYCDERLFPQISSFREILPNAGFDLLALRYFSEEFTDDAITFRNEPLDLQKLSASASEENVLDPGHGPEPSGSEQPPPGKAGENELLECPVCFATIYSDDFYLTLGCSHALCTRCFRCVESCPVCRNSLGVFTYRGLAFHELAEDDLSGDSERSSK